MNASSNGKPQICSIKLTSKSQLSRLKREEEEELWISGEELYTEGSSDEEEYHSKSRKFHSGNKSRPESSLCKHNLIAHETCSRRQNQVLPSAPLAAELEMKTAQLVEAAENKIGETRMDKSRNTSRDNAASSPSLSDSANDSECALFSAPEEKDDVTVNSNENLHFNSASEEEDTEISWKPRRVKERRSLIFEEAVVALRELQLDYHEVSKAVEQLHQNLSPQRNCCDADISSERLENVIHECKSEAATYTKDIDVSLNVADKDVKMRNEMLKVQEFDISIQELEKEIEVAQKETVEYQLRNREELKKLLLLRPPETGKLANNTEQFFKLYSKNTTPTDSIEEIEMQADITAMENTRKRDNVKYMTETRKQKWQMLKRTLSDINKKEVTFVRKNKELAACSMGSLTITDEEKQRLNSLMVDIDKEDTGIDTCSMSRDIENKAALNPFSIDEDTKKLLQEMDAKLTDINTKAYKLSHEIESGQKELLNQKMKQNHQSLNTFTISNSKEIYPISNEEIQKLVEEYRAEIENVASESENAIITNNPIKLITSTNIPNATSGITVDTTVSSLGSIPTISNIQSVDQDIIQELIKEAKVKMPLFQFKYLTDMVEKT